MTDLTPEQSEAVRRLLAEARADEPMPAVVADRLDAVLAGLAADRTASDRTASSPPALAPVVALRRRWPAALLAAAAVSAIAFGATQVLGPQAGDDAGTASEDVAAESGDTGSLAEDRELAPPAASAPSPTSDAAVPPTELGYASDEDLAAGLSDLVQSGARVLDGPWLQAYLPDVTAATRGSLAGKEFQPADGAIDRLSGTSCGPLDPFPLSTAYAALYRGHVALVVALPAIDGVHTVQVFDCQGGAPRLAARTVTVPAGEASPGD